MDGRLKPQTSPTLIYPMASLGNQLWGGISLLYEIFPIPSHHTIPNSLYSQVITHPLNLDTYLHHIHYSHETHPFLTTQSHPNDAVTIMTSLITSLFPSPILNHDYPKWTQFDTSSIAFDLFLQPIDLPLLASKTSQQKSRSTSKHVKFRVEKMHINIPEHVIQANISMYASKEFIRKFLGLP